jgi:hypothetical protein
VDIDPIERHARRSASEARAEQSHLVPATREPPEDLVEMGLGATRLRVFTVLPVDDVDSHGGRVLRVLRVQKR